MEWYWYVFWAGVSLIALDMVILGTLIIIWTQDWKKMTRGRR